MTTTPQQQLSELSLANLEKSIRLTHIALNGAERMLNLQMEMTRDLLAENAATAKALAGIKNAQELMEFQKNLAQPSISKPVALARTVYETAAATQSELNKLVEEQLIDFNKNLLNTLNDTFGQVPASAAAISAIKNAVESATTAYDTVSKTTKRITSELAEATVSAVESSAKAASKSASRKTT